MPRPTPTSAPTPAGLYLHVPFCTVKCAYCDFNSYAGIDAQIPAWEAALLDELRRWAPVLAGRPVPTLFFGGGTPSLLEGASVARILETVRDRYALAHDAEITLEANPESVRPQRLRAYRAAGVNRISIGAQSFHDDELRWLDRLHSAADVRAAVEAARGAGFQNLSLDLIFGLPGQPLARWAATLDSALGLAPDHLSCYGLTVEEGTPLAERVRRGEEQEADPDTVAEMAEFTEERLQRAGYHQYEISNYARPGRECRHNLVYWRHGEYVGVGPGAHGFVDGVRYAVERSPTRYIEALRHAGGVEGLPSPAVVSREELDEKTAALDTLVLRLRLNEGVSVEDYRAAHPAAWDRYSPALAWAESEALLHRRDGRLHLTPRGRGLSNEVFVRLLEPSLL